MNVFPSNRMKTCLVAAFVIGFVIGLSGEPHPVRAAAGPSITLSQGEISEGDDYATRVLGQPWDMNSGPYPDFQYVLGDYNIDRATFSAKNGVWSMQSSSNDPGILILPMNQDTGLQTQHVLKLGDSYPIDGSRYHLLSFRLCSDYTKDPDYLQIYWWYHWGPGASPTLYAPVTMVKGCHLYVIDLSKVPGWSGTQPKMLRIDPGVYAQARHLQLDWIRLTSADTANVMRIDWSNAAQGTNLGFYLNRSCSLTDAMQIGRQTSAASRGSFTWGNSLTANGNGTTPFPLPESFEPGPYYVFASDGTTSTPNCMPITIHKAPILEFEKPSRFSGPDYATQQTGNFWGMSDPLDVIFTNDIAQMNFDQGILSGVSTANDPYVWLNVGAPVNTAAYKYVTFRMYLEGQVNQWTGGVARFLWWNGDVSNVATTQDIILHEGWQTYSFDLSKAPVVEPGRSWTGSGAVTTFRFDPDEDTNSLWFHLDYISLTGDETVRQGQVFPLVYQIKAGTAQQITFFYGPSPNSPNGRRPVAVAQASGNSNLINLPNRFYLPLLVNRYSSENNLVQGLSQGWDTSGVAPGSYYISADISDGLMTTTWYSDVPVIVQ